MSHRHPRKKRKTAIIDGRQAGICELCGKLEELRPYGPNGEKVCFDCMMLNEPAAKKAFCKILDEHQTVIII